jgi:aerobic-type carbon monoxide dehydrogenase small subunit (CoxS/CutS family)
MSLPAHRLTVTINGKIHGPIDVPVGLMMIDVLHEFLDLTGSRFGCGQGICHACVVIWDRDDGASEEVRTCITGADFFDGKRIRTIEGIAERNDDSEVVALSPVQQAFLDHFSFQCGYCTPGFVKCRHGADRTAAALAGTTRTGRGNRRHGAGKPHLPLYRICALLSGDPGPDPDNARPDA